MKVLAVLLFCAFVAVQGRSAGEKSSKAVAERGESPWLVHLRVAVATSGYLNTAAGVLISNRWVLTSAEGVDQARFVWIRYDTVNVINPGLVTEVSVTDTNNAVTKSADGKVAILAINRIVESSSFISPATLSATLSVPESLVFNNFGENAGVPGEILKSFYVSLASQEDGSIIASSDDGKASKFDLGAPLVSDGVLVGVLVQEGGADTAGVFANVAGYIDWIVEVTGIELDSGSVEPEDSLRVHFVN